MQDVFRVFNLNIGIVTGYGLMYCFHAFPEYPPSFILDPYGLSKRYRNPNLAPQPTALYDAPHLDMRGKHLDPLRDYRDGIADNYRIAYNSVDGCRNFHPMLCRRFEIADLHAHGPYLRQVPGPIPLELIHREPQGLYIDSCRRRVDAESPHV